MPTTGDRAYRVSLYIRYTRHNTLPSIRDKESVRFVRWNIRDKHAAVDIDSRYEVL